MNHLITYQAGTLQGGNKTKKNSSTKRKFRIADPRTGIQVQATQRLLLRDG